MNKPTDKKQCRGRVWQQGAWRDSQCLKFANPKSKDGDYCMTHCPDRVAEKRAKSSAEFNAAAVTRRRFGERRTRVLELMRGLCVAPSEHLIKYRTAAQNLLAEYADLDEGE